MTIALCGAGVQTLKPLPQMRDTGNQVRRSATAHRLAQVSPTAPCHRTARQPTTLPKPLKYRAGVLATVRTRQDLGIVAADAIPNEKREPTHRGAPHLPISLLMD